MKIKLRILSSFLSLAVCASAVQTFENDIVTDSTLEATTERPDESQPLDQTLEEDPTSFAAISRKLAAQQKALDRQDTAISQLKSVVNERLDSLNLKITSQNQLINDTLSQHSKILQRLSEQFLTLSGGAFQPQRAITLDQLSRELTKTNEKLDQLATAVKPLVEEYEAKQTAIAQERFRNETRYFRLNFEDISKTHRFRTMSILHIMDVLLSDELKVTSEAQVYEAMMSWIDSHTDSTHQIATA